MFGARRSRESLSLLAVMLAVTGLWQLVPVANASPVSPGIDSARVGSLQAAAQNSDSSRELVGKWFSETGEKYAQALMSFIPSGIEKSGETRLKLGSPIQAYSWSRTFLTGAYSLETALQPIDLWVAPVRFKSVFLGVVVYTRGDSDLFPLKPPYDKTLLPKVSDGVSTPASTASGSASKVVIEPKDSYLPIKSAPPGTVYALPKLAKEIFVASEKTKLAYPVYDPVIDAWFIVKDEQLNPASNAARQRLGGSVALPGAQSAVQSWWGTASEAPTPEPTRPSIPASTIILFVVLSFVGAGLVALFVWLGIRRQARLGEEVLPLPDPEIMVAAPPPPTSAIPTLLADSSTR